MWLNDEQVTDFAIGTYQKSLLNSCPNHIVIDNLFNETKLDDAMRSLRQPHNWQTQRHTYSALYVDNTQWEKTSDDQRFVQRDVWRPKARCSIHDGFDTDISTDVHSRAADDFLSFLRGDQFMSILSRIFNVTITDMNVADPEINTNYFRLSAADFVEQHADDSPGREVCMLLYLNKEWNENTGGELVFIGKHNDPISIAPLYNRCVLFDPSSKGSEHWVKKLDAEKADQYRYNVTSWYWSE
ncbi:MAG: 2OG-Fe(II) oxygenase [Oleispira antarctica]|nr:2OG-Fe(II) oxygenase [Oleispira antarctica]MBQ0791442.1 2OG-Fe(II) oxygenase [Oleispira antarctica]